MARYFFHIQTDSRLTDDDGMELISPQEARAQAIATCAEIVRDNPDSFWGSRPWTVVVTDARGVILWDIAMDAQASPTALALEGSLGPL